MHVFGGGGDAALALRVDSNSRPSANERYFLLFRNYCNYPVKLNITTTTNCSARNKYYAHLECLLFSVLSFGCCCCPNFRAGILFFLKTKRNNFMLLFIITHVYDCSNRRESVHVTVDSVVNSKFLFFIINPPQCERERETRKNRKHRTNVK